MSSSERVSSDHGSAKPTQPARAPVWRWLNLGFFAIGAVGLAVMIRHIGVDTLKAGLARVGWGFAGVLALHLLAIVIDAITLRAAAGAVGGDVRLRTYVRVSLCGHAINEATPLAKLGEVTKYNLLSDHLAPDRAAAALIVQNFVMGIANCLLLVAAPIASLLAFSIDDKLRSVFIIGIVIFALVGFLLIVILRFGPGVWPFRLARRLGCSTERVDAWHTRWIGVEHLWREVVRHRRSMWIAGLSGVASRIASIGQVALILWLLGEGNVVALAILNTASFQLMLWTTSFIPLQSGSAEGSSYVLFSGVGASAELGVLVEIVRKLRRITFIAVGVLLLGWKSARG